MGTVILIVSLGAAMNLALWGAIYHRLQGFPASVWRVVERSRVASETRALDVLQAAAASRLGGLVIGVQTYHEQLAGLVRSQVADAEVRARVTERRAVEAGIALDAASALVRELRTLTEDLPSLIDRRVVKTDGRERQITPAPPLVQDGEERDTVEMLPGATAPEPPREPERPASASRLRPLTAPREPVDEERVSGDEELTMVQGHPLPGVQTLASAGASCGQGGAR